MKNLVLIVADQSFFFFFLNMLLPFEEQQSQLWNTRILREDFGWYQKNPRWICSACCNLFRKAEEAMSCWISCRKVDAELWRPGGFILAAGCSRSIFEDFLPWLQGLREKLCRVTPLALWQLGNSLVLRLFLVNLVLLASVPLYVAVTVWST